MTSKIKQQYQNAFKQHGRTPASVLCPKGRQHNRFAGMLEGIDISNKSVLDFGCGLGDLLPYWKEKGGGGYQGVDMVDEFVDSNNETHGQFFKKISSVSEIREEVDVVFASGVFNIKYCEQEIAHIDEVFSILDVLWGVTREVLVVDFLSDMVDFKVDGAFHFPPECAIAEFKNRYGRRFELSHSYLPFEYCMRARKRQAIVKGESVFRYGC